MICLSRLNGQVFALNADLIERVDATPDTVITMVDGVKYVVADGLADVVSKVVAFRAAIVARSQDLATEPAAPVLQVVNWAEED
jgi:flagellar protein FlbD